MRYAKYCLICIDGNDQICSVFPVFEKREDLYTFLGLIINRSSCLISINYLFYFDGEFDKFDSWVLRCLDTDATMCIFTEVDRTFRIKVKPII